MRTANDNPPINQPRRQNRAKDDVWITALLHRLPFGMLATEWQGQPFLKPTLYAFDEAAHAIYLHAALEGRMRTNLEANPRVCFSVAEMGRLMPAPTTMEFGVEYASAVVFGKAVLISDEAEATYGLQLLLDRYFPHLKPGVDYQPITPEEVNITAVYRIDIDAWSGKAEELTKTSPDMFYFDQPPTSTHQ